MKKLVLVAAGMAALAGGIATAGPKDNSWTKLSDAKWEPLDPKAGDKGPMWSLVWGDMKKGPAAFLLKIPAGFKPGPHTHTSDDYATVIQGTVHNFPSPGTDEGPGLTAGGQWFQPGGKVHDNDCEASSKDGCLLYVYVPKGFDFKPAAAPKK
jgi:hypothetical protein